MLQGSCMVWELPVQELEVLLWAEPQLEEPLSQYLASTSRRYTPSLTMCTQYTP